MPKSCSCSIRWDTQASSYQVAEQRGGKTISSHLDFQGQQWQEWLQQVPSFAFLGKGGYRLTARKETRARGDTYWIAYRKIDGKLAHKYLGRPVDVTLIRLEEVAAALAVRETWADLSIAMTEHQERLMQNQFVDQLLLTKFFLPVSSHALISRSRLFGLLDEGLQHSLTLVSAPAGFGKTTLLSSWLQARPENAAQVAWVSLDEEENDPLRFWMYLITALDRVQPGVYSDLLGLLRTRPALSLSSLPAALINRLAYSREQVLLVLDNFHVICEETLWTAFAMLLDRLPPQVHVILSTRVDPPLPLSRMRARGQLLEVREEQLCCTDSEIEAFFREVVGIELESSQVRQVYNKSEGWLAGLQILGRSLHALLHEKSYPKHSLLPAF